MIPMLHVRCQSFMGMSHVPWIEVLPGECACVSIMLRPVTVLFRIESPRLHEHVQGTPFPPLYYMQASRACPRRSLPAK